LKCGYLLPNPTPAVSGFEDVNPAPKILKIEIWNTSLVKAWEDIHFLFVAYIVRC